MPELRPGLRDPGRASCPHDGGVLDVRYESASFPLQPDLPGIWRYAARLPLTDAKHIVSLGEGNTPMTQSAQLGAAINLPQLYFKNEGLNPTGSYKDRIASVGITYLRQLGRRAWAATVVGQRRRLPGRLWRARRRRRLSLHAGAGAAGQDRPDHGLWSAGDVGQATGL